MSRRLLPLVSVNLAITADGKIAPDHRRFTPFSSPRDHESMMELRSEADAVLSGARTVDLGRVDLGPGGRKFQRRRLSKGLAEYNLRVIVSGSATIDPNAHIFQKRFSPILLLTSAAAPKTRLESLRPLFADMFISSGEKVDFPQAFEWLRSQWGVKKLLCEGGGEVNAPILRAGLVSYLYLTIVPVIFGGRSAPTLADGDGIEPLEDAVRLRLLRRELIRSELYCVYKCLPHPARIP